MPAASGSAGSAGATARSRWRGSRSTPLFPGLTPLFPGLFMAEEHTPARIPGLSSNRKQPSARGPRLEPPVIPEPSVRTRQAGWHSMSSSQRFSQPRTSTSVSIGPQSLTRSLERPRWPAAVMRPMITWRNSQWSRDGMRFRSSSRCETFSYPISERPLMSSFDSTSVSSLGRYSNSKYRGYSQGFRWCPSTHHTKRSWNRQHTHIVSVVLSCRGAARRTLSTPEPRARSQIGASIVSKDGAF